MFNKTIFVQPFWYLVLLMFVAIPPAQATDQWNKLVDAMKSRLAAAEKNNEFSGAILIGVGDEIIYSQAFGLAKKGLNVPNKVDTKFNLGSLDKQFTMVAVMRLVDEGKIDLDANIASYLPDWPTAARPPRANVQPDKMFSLPAQVFDAIKSGDGGKRIVIGLKLE